MGQPGIIRAVLSQLEHLSQAGAEAPLGSDRYGKLWRPDLHVLRFHLCRRSDGVRTMRFAAAVISATARVVQQLGRSIPDRYQCAQQNGQHVYRLGGLFDVAIGAGRSIREELSWIAGLRPTVTVTLRCKSFVLPFVPH